MKGQVFRSFASKVMGHLRFGLAAGCAAAAMPRRRCAFPLLGYALGAAFGPIDPERLSPDQKHITPTLVLPHAEQNLPVEL